MTLAYENILKEEIYAPYPRIIPEQNTSNLRVGPQQNCENATPICSSAPIVEPDAYSLQQNSINTLQSCLGTGAINGVWYQFQASVSGLLNFTIIPNVNTSDYDWAVYDLSNDVCSNIRTNPALEIACNYSGSITAPGETTASGETGPNGRTGSQFTSPVSVTAGNIYRIFVTFYNGSVVLQADQGAGLGFTLDVQASTPGLFDIPEITLTPSSAEVCVGSSITLTASGAGAGSTYSWSVSNDLNTTSGEVVVATPSQNTSYSVSATTGANCATNTATAVVSINSILPQWSTYFGGTEYEIIKDISVSPFNGNLLVTGTADGLTQTLPTTASTVIRTTGIRGSGDAFLAELSPDGFAVNWIHYFGNEFAQEPTDLSIDNNGKIYLTFKSQTADYTNQVGVGTFEPTGENIWLNYYGEKIDVTALTLTENSIFVAGRGLHAAVIPSPVINAHSPLVSSYNHDIFVIQINSTTGTVNWSTFFDYLAYKGITDEVFINDLINNHSIIADASGDLYLAGRLGNKTANEQKCMSIKFDGTTGVPEWAEIDGLGLFSSSEAIALQGNEVLIGGYVNGTSAYGPYGGGDGADIILSKRDQNTGTVTLSNVITGNVTDMAYGLTVGSDNAIYVTGYAVSSDLFTAFSSLNNSLDSYQDLHTSFMESCSKCQDVFVGKFSSDFIPQWFTYLGSSTTDQTKWGNDIGNAIAVDTDGSIYVAGSTNSLDFQVTTPAIQETKNLGGEAFIAKFSCTDPGVVTSANYVSNVSKSILSIYPNPASDHIRIEIPGNYNSEKYQVVIVDMMGRIVQVEENIKSLNSIFLNVERGTYLIRVIGESFNETVTFTKL